MGRADHGGRSSSGCSAVQRFGTAKVSRGLRAGHGGLVPGARVVGLMHIVEHPEVLLGAQSGLRHHLPRHPSGASRRRRRRGVPRGDRRRGALCRPRPFRPEADRRRLVHPGLSRACCSTISGRARSCSATATAVDESVLRDASRTGRSCRWWSSRRGDGHREPGGDHRAPIRWRSRRSRSISCRA